MKSQIHENRKNKLLRLSKNLIVLFLTITSLTMFSCSKDDDEQQSTPDLLIGRWYYVSGVTATKTKTDPAKSSKRLSVAEKVTQYIEFSDGTSFTQGSQTGTVSTNTSVTTYTKLGNIISITSSKGIVVDITISQLNATELILLYGKNSGREGDTETYTKNINNAADMQ